MKVIEIIIRRLERPLANPYPVAYGTFEAFLPIVVEARDADGRTGWGEGHIVPGSSSETPDGGWAFCRDAAAAAVGGEIDTVTEAIAARKADSMVATTALASALEMLGGDPLLEITKETRLPLLAPINAKDEDAIVAEVEDRLAEGFKTLKVKVGKDVDGDLARLGIVQAVATGRATLRLDANRGFDRAEGIRFAEGLNGDGLELFEQPCAAEDWDANAAVAAASPVPIMLDEPICDLADIERASAIDGIGLCKLKLRRFGGLGALAEALHQVRELGMEPVLGDGIAGEICGWMEACVARSTIRNAGEFNGFLKPADGLLVNPMPFADGCLILPAGFTPEIDRERLDGVTVAQERFAA